MASPSLVWLRDDLRLADNPALRAAIDRGEPLVVLFVLDEESPGIRPLGGAARWWLHHSLASLDDALRELGATLTLRRGPAERVVRETVADSGATAVFWNRRYGGAEREVDTALKAALRADGHEVTSFQASLLHEPWTVKTGGGTHFSVFTPFWRACLSLPTPRVP
ncbi:deoxyribodipyrimidine photo-lyase, partial [uncultured Microbacterium sp.]|uniref:deoxyribodipyrimidine photo-lyase n=1 Tax=uncultured Microbacterium sp. TaxID=191216 RepID=UPI0025E8E5AB